MSRKYHFLLFHGQSLLALVKKDRANREVFKISQLSMVLTLCATTIMILFKEKRLGLFTNNPEIIVTVAFLLILGFILEPGRCLNFVSKNNGLFLVHFFSYRSTWRWERWIMKLFT